MAAAQRVLKVVAIAIALITCLVLLAVGGLFAYAAIDKEDRFYVVDAEPADSNYLLSLDADPTRSAYDRQRFGFFVHRMKRGRGIVFGFRYYSNGRVTVADDESYRKVTVWLPEGAPQSTTTIDLADRSSAVVVYSRGGSAWPRNDCSGYVSSGSLRLEPHAGRIAVSVHGQLEPRGSSEVFKGCRSEPVSLEFEASELSFEKLTPWLGVAGSYPYEETYR